MSNYKQCSATTKKGQQCKNTARFEGYCSTHRYKVKSKRKSNTDRDQCLVNLLTAGVSLIVIVEKALKYIPQLIEIADQFSPIHQKGLLRITYRKEELNSENLYELHYLARDIMLWVYWCKCYTYGGNMEIESDGHEIELTGREQIDLWAKLPDDLKDQLEYESMKYRYFEQLSKCE